MLAGDVLSLLEQTAVKFYISFLKRIINDRQKDLYNLGSLVFNHQWFVLQITRLTIIPFLLADGNICDECVGLKFLLKNTSVIHPELQSTVFTTKEPRDTHAVSGHFVRTKLNVASSDSYAR